MTSRFADLPADQQDAIRQVVKRAPEQMSDRKRERAQMLFRVPLKRASAGPDRPTPLNSQPIAQDHPTNRATITGAQEKESARVRTSGR